MSSIHTEKQSEFKLIYNYKMPKWEVIAESVVILLIAGFSSSLYWPLGLIVMVLGFGLLAFRLQTKHKLTCPKCGEPWYGKFRVLTPKITHCQACGLSLIPD